MKRKLWAVLVLLVLLAASCGGQPVEPTGAAPAGGQVLQIALPRLVIDVDAQGNPSILGISPALLSAFGVDVSGFRLPPATVEQAMKAGVQHLEVASVGDRLLMFVDGKPLPHLSWTPESLNRALDFATVLDVQNASTLGQVLPLITRLGLDVVMRFPRAEGASEIPMASPDVVRTQTPKVTTEPVSAIIKFEVRYDENGQAHLVVPSSGGNSDIAIPMGAISPATMQKLQAGNVQSIEIRTKPDGAYIYVNNEPLPKLSWDTELLSNLVDTFARFAPDGSFLPLVQNIAPYVDRADVGILIHFPVAQGQAPIQAQMH